MCEDSATIDVAIFDASHDGLQQAMIVQVTPKGVHASIVTCRTLDGGETMKYEVGTTEQWRPDSTVTCIDLGSISSAREALAQQSSQTTTAITHCVVSCGSSVHLLSTSYSYQTQIIVIEDIWSMSLRSWFYYLSN